MMPYGFKPPMARMPQQMQIPNQMPSDMGFDGKMLRKTMPRKTVDFNPSAINYLENRIWQRDYNDRRALQFDILHMQSLTLPIDMPDCPVSCVTTKFIRAALNKDPRPIFCSRWTPDGRRLITGASSGEFTLWNGLTFNFETILQAHNSAVRAMIWSRNEQWMITGDDKGYIKYWQANMNNVKMFQGHNEAIRGLSFAPTDAKFTSCSDDRTVRIFDFVTCQEESVLQGHGSGVKCVDWHPTKGLIVSGSKDSQQPIILWDARNAKKIITLHAHKNTCTDLKWNSFNGNWLISSSKDHLCKLFDLRKLKEEVQTFRGHKKDVCTVAWHPIYEKLFVSGGLDGSMYFWLVGSDKELGFMENAHEAMIWDLSWHPLGHILVSGSNDRSTRFWTRNRPGDTSNEKIEESPNFKMDRVSGIIFKNIELTVENKEEESLISLPGLGLDKEIFDTQKEEDESDKEESESTIDTNEQQKNSNQLAYERSDRGNRNDRNEHRADRNDRGDRGSYYRRDNSGAQDFDEDELRRKKAPYCKPIPKDFEKAWKSNTASANTDNLDVANKANANNNPMALMDLMSNNPKQGGTNRNNANYNNGNGGRNPKKRRNDNSYDND